MTFVPLGGYLKDSMLLLGWYFEKSKYSTLTDVENADVDLVSDSWGYELFNN